MRVPPLPVPDRVPTPPFTEKPVALLPPPLANVSAPPAVRYIPERWLLPNSRLRPRSARVNVLPDPLAKRNVKRGSNIICPADFKPTRTSTGVPMWNTPGDALGLLYTMPTSPPHSLCATASDGLTSPPATSSAVPIRFRIFILLRMAGLRGPPRWGTPPTLRVRNGPD